MYNNKNRGQNLKRKIFKHIDIIIEKIEKIFARIPRTRLIFFSFLSITFIILYTSLSYQVFDYEYWRDRADSQQLRKDKTLVNRGTIYSNNIPKGVYAVSAELSDIAIDPSQEGDKNQLKDFLSKVIFKHYCSDIINESCIKGVSRFIGLSNYYELDLDKDIIKEKIDLEIEEILKQKYITKVLIKKGLTELSKQKIHNLNYSELYFVSDNLYLDLNSTIKNKSALINDLSNILDIKKDKLESKFKKREIKYIPIIKKVSISLRDYIDLEIEKEKEKIRRRYEEKKKKLKILAKNEKSEEYKTLKNKKIKKGFIDYLILSPHPSRFYPERDLAPQVIGFIDNSLTGQYGIEGYFNNELKGQQGIKLGRKDIRGNPIGKISKEQQIEKNGINITLTLDRNIQKNVEQILEKGVKKTGANKGTIVVMNPKTGSVLAMANYPKFDPNNFGEVYEIEKLNERGNILGKYKGYPLFVEDNENGEEFKIKGEIKFLRKATNNEIQNNAIPKYKYKNNIGLSVFSNDAISALYEPGSIFKAITIAIGIDSGEILPTDKYYDKGYAKVGPYTIKNVSSNCTGTHSFLNALNWSCNVGMIKVAQKTGPAIFEEYMRDFGFGKKTNITLDNEVFGKITPHEQWSKSQLFTTSYGRGMTATVIQMAAAYSALANGGIYYQPYIVDSITRPDGTVIKNEPIELRRVIKQKTSEKVTYMLVDGVKKGFAKVGAVEGYNLAGKTGTSGIPNGRGGYEKGYATTMGSYAGYGPIYSNNKEDLPIFVVIIKLERPRTSQYGGATAGPIFAEVMKYLLKYTGIAKYKN